MPYRIKHVSVTLDGQYLWVQTNMKCYLYHGQESVIYHCNGIRIYGKNNHCYLEINDGDCFVYIDNQFVQKIYNVVSAAMDYYHHVHVVKDNQKFTHVKILHDKPYYF